MKKEVEFFFDVGSPTAYLAYTQLPGIAARASAEIVWKPILLGGLFKAVGNQIDLSYYYGIRSHPLSFVGDLGEERIQELQVGVTLADLWFVRRRQR